MEARWIEESEETRERDLQIKSFTHRLFNQNNLGFV